MMQRCGWSWYPYLGVSSQRCLSVQVEQLLFGASFKGRPFFSQIQLRRVLRGAGTKVRDSSKINTERGGGRQGICFSPSKALQERESYPEAEATDRRESMRLRAAWQELRLTRAERRGMAKRECVGIWGMPTKVGLPYDPKGNPQQQPHIEGAKGA